MITGIGRAGSPCLFNHKTKRYANAQIKDVIGAPSPGIFQTSILVSEEQKKPPEMSEDGGKDDQGKQPAGAGARAGALASS